MNPAQGLLRRIAGKPFGRVSVNALALLTAQVGARLLNLLLIAQLTRALGVASLGRYLLAMTVEAITLAVADLGLNTLTTREFARERPDDEAEALWGTYLGLRLLAALGSILVLNLVVAPILFAGERHVLVIFVSLAVPAGAFNGLVTALIKARQRMVLSSAIHLGIRVLATLCGIWLVMQGGDERTVVLSYGVISVLGSMAFGVVLRVWGIHPRWAALAQRWRPTLRESLPFAVTGVTALLYQRIDLLMLSYWQGDMAAGLYGAAYRLWEALAIVPTSFLDALFPELSRVSSAQAGGTPLRAIYRRARLMLWLVVAVLVVPCVLLAPRLVDLLYGQGQNAAVSAALFRGLLLASPFTYFYLLNGHALYAVGRQRRVTRAMVAITGVNALLNALLVPIWSYRGALVVTIASEGLLFVLMEVECRRFVLHTDSVSNGGDGVRHVL